MGKKINQINELDGYDAILTWPDVVSMVRAAFEGDGRHFHQRSIVSGLHSMAEGTKDGGNGSRDKSSSDEAALSARLGSLDHRLSEIRGSRKIGTDPSESGSGDGAARASAMAIGFRLSSELVAGVVVGALIGWGFDRLLSTSPFGLIVFLLLGFVAGVVNVVRSAGVAPGKR
jgi:ATP synthase protein I